MEGCNRHNEVAVDVPNRVSFSKQLFRYTAATSYARILRRLTSRKNFLNSLLAVTEKNVPIPSQSRRTSQWLNIPSNQPTRDELEHDHLFLKDFVKRIRKLSTPLGVEVPNLQRLADQNTPGRSIYNDDTCVEFHNVLIRLLTLFKERLTSISRKEQGTSTDPVSLKGILPDVQEYAYALLRLAKGYALKVHMANLNITSLDAPPTQAPNAAEQDNKVEEPDEELEALRPGNYAGWLQLVLAHFDAVEIVFSYMTSVKHPDKDIRTSIDAKILVAPLASNRMYPWQDLFKDNSKFSLPSSTDFSTTNSPPVSNAQLLLFLKATVDKAWEAQTLASLTSSVRDNWKKHDEPTFKYNTVKEPMENLAQKTLAIIEFAWEEGSLEPPKPPLDLNATVSTVLSKLEGWAQLRSDDQQKKVVADEITDSISILSRELIPIPLVYSFLANLSDKAGKHAVFKGSMHCESCLASVLDVKAGSNTSPKNYSETPELSSIFSEMDVSMLCYQFFIKSSAFYRDIAELSGCQNVAAQFAQNISIL